MHFFCSLPGSYELNSSVHTRHTYTYVCTASPLFNHHPAESCLLCWRGRVQADWLKMQVAMHGR